MSKRISRFRFKGLEKLSSDQVLINNALVRSLAKAPFDKKFRKEIEGKVGGLLRAPFELSHVKTQRVPAGSFISKLQRPLCVGLVSMLPEPGHLFLEIDITAAQAAIDHMIGGDGTDIDPQRPLSDIESGLLSFLFIQGLSSIKENIAEHSQVSLKLEGATSDSEFLKLRVDEAQDHICATFKIFVGREIGFLRVYLPEGVFDENWKKAETSDIAIARQMKHLEDSLSLAETLPADIHVSVGKLALTPDEVAQLEVEDIILVENSEIRLEGDACVGEAQCTVGSGKAGSIMVSLNVGAENRYELTVEQILRLEQPPEHGKIVEEEQVVNEQDAANEEHSMELSPEGLPPVRFDMDAIKRPTARSLMTGMVTDDAEVSRQEHQDDESEDGSAALEPAPDEDMSDEGPSPDAAQLLNDVTISLSVELGRVSVSAADVVQLRAGQVIELGRSPGDPVDLIIDDKRFGRGELVEIEGDLGVRILSIRR